MKINKKELLKLLEYLLNEISYIRTHTDEISVLAGLNLMEQKINEYKNKMKKEEV